MSDSDQNILREYPVFSLIFLKDCRSQACEIDDIQLKTVGIKKLPESYISEYHCISPNGRTINALIGHNINCPETKFPLDAFLIAKTGIDTGDEAKNLATYQDEEMPASDYCSLIDQNTAQYALPCGKMVHGFPYTDEIHGYVIRPITNENREAIYTEFKERGFRYEDSKIVMNKMVAEFNQEVLTTAIISSCIVETPKANIASDAPQAIESTHSVFFSYCNNVIGDFFGICDYLF